MMKRTLIVSVLASALAFSAGFTAAASQQQIQRQEQIYGSQLMTQQERDQFRAEMRGATTAQERDQIRRKHHEQMKVRAQAQGMTLPDEPPVWGGGTGLGAGGGMGPGGGAGRGGGGRGGR